MNCTLINNYCGNNGLCNSFEGNCNCFEYYSGEHCDIPYSQFLGKFYRVWVFFFIVVFGILLFFILFKFISILIKQRLNLNKQKLKIICFCFLSTSILSNILYLTIDPFKSKRNNWHIVIKILVELIGGFGLYILVSTYLLVLVYWIGLYHYKSSGSSGNKPINSIKIKNSNFNPIARNVYITFESCWLIYELVIKCLNCTNSIIISKQYKESLLKFNNIFMIVLSFIIAIGFITYGILIYKRIKNVILYKNQSSKQIIIKKLMFVATILSKTFLIIVISIILLIKFNISTTVNYYNGDVDQSLKSTKYNPVLVFGLQFIFEIILSLEMVYILKDHKVVKPKNKIKNDRHRFYQDKDNNNNNIKESSDMVKDKVEINCTLDQGTSMNIDIDACATINSLSETSTTDTNTTNTTTTTV